MDLCNLLLRPGKSHKDTIRHVTKELLTGRELRAYLTTMAKKRSSTPTSTKPPENTIHAKLPVTEIEKLDRLAKANNITRSALIQIACARILKSGV